MSDPADREFRLAFCKVHVLHHAAQGPIYGHWMLEELAEHGHRLSPGTLYPMLGRMAANGWLSAKPSAGKRRRDYVITDAGRALLARLRAEIAELHREVVVEASSAAQHAPTEDAPADRRPRAAEARS